LRGAAKRFLAPGPPMMLENLGWSRWRDAINKTSRAIQKRSDKVAELVRFNVIISS
jgi:hypothetical protein